MTLATSIALPAVRHPVVLAKAIASLAVLAEGPVVAGLGPGSSPDDYRAVGSPSTSAGRGSTRACVWSARCCAGEPTSGGDHYPAGGCVSIRSRRSRRRSGSAAGDPTSAPAHGRCRGRLVRVRLQHDSRTIRRRPRPARRPPGGCGRRPGDLPRRRRHGLAVRHPRRGRGGPRAPGRPRARCWARITAGLAAQLPVGSPEHCIELLDRATRPPAPDGSCSGPSTTPTGSWKLFADEVRPSPPEPARGR